MMKSIHHSNSGNTYKDRPLHNGEK